VFKDGSYSVWFQTNSNREMGIAHFAHGEVWGSDNTNTYRGSYEVEGDRLTISVSTTKLGPSHSTVFGADDLTLKFVGKTFGKMAACTGSANQMPGLRFTATLILREAQTAPPQLSEPVVFDPAKLRKLPTLPR